MELLLAASLGDPSALVRRGGRITEVAASFYRVSGLEAQARLGDVVEHRGATGLHWGEISRVSQDSVIVSPYEGAAEAGLGESVFRRGPLKLFPTPAWRGRVVDALGRPVDGGVALPAAPEASSASAGGGGAPRALARARLGKGLKTGVKVVDIFTPICFGQRVGVFAGSGVGKSTLLAMLARAESFDTVVVALVGERGREVREFLEDTLGAAGRQKTVAVVATGDESAALRKRAPLTAMQLAEHFRDLGQNVLLVLDSVTRFAHAAREVASAAGEPPVARGYPASVFTELPRLLERAGPGSELAGGSITAIVSVLVDGDDMNDPVADAVRGILDGHLVLKRAIAEENRFPAVDPLASLSRLAPKLWSAEERALVGKLRAMIARFEETRDIRLLGAYQLGADPALDQAVRQAPVIFEALTQRPDEPHSTDALGDLARHLRSREGRDG
ncbi:MAG TPA: FliI/YscN family ATPase [Mesorhizobium sp.]|nr:FliI/YscN family ATPase [Mesorhizobium sp.]